MLEREKKLQREISLFDRMSKKWVSRYVCIRRSSDKCANCSFTFFQPKPITFRTSFASILCESQHIFALIYMVWLTFSTHADMEGPISNTIQTWLEAFQPLSDLFPTGFAWALPTFQLWLGHDELYTRFVCTLQIFTSLTRISPKSH